MKTDTRRLIQIYEGVQKSLRAFECEGSFNDYDLDCKVDEMYKVIDEIGSELFHILQDEDTEEWRQYRDTVVF